jgi:hypothetical protein
VKQFAPLVFGVVVASVAFALMWRKGYFLKISNYVQETKEADFIISLFVHLIA